MSHYKEDDASCLAVVTELLNRSVEIATRVSLLSTSNVATDGQLGALLCTEIESFAKTVFRLRAEFLDFVQAVNATSTGLEHLDLPPKLAHALVSTKLRMFEVLELIDFYQGEETSGQEGALNARFAENHILGRHVGHDTDPTYFSEDKLIRTGIALQNLIHDLAMATPPSATFSANTAVQQFQRFEYSPTHVPPSPPFSAPTAKEPLADGDDCRTRIESCVALIKAQYRSRYVHVYGSPTEVPYELDPTGVAFSGSYGTVQKVNLKHRAEPLAMKTFRNVFKGNATRKVLREIGVLEVCHHRNIVRLVEAFKVEEEEHCIRLVIRPWAPYTLTNFLHATDSRRKTRCPWFQPRSSKSDSCIRRIMCELADAVGYLHGRSIKHKDLKPDNILLHLEGGDHVTPLITDVGISKIYIHGASTNPQDSTWAYLSPEQHDGTGCTLKSDIWQLGCCFAELLGLAVGGTTTYQLLHGSFNREEENCSCSIALEITPFIESLAGLCLRGSTAQKRTYGIITGMLDTDPAVRLDIESVRAAIYKLPGSH